MRLSFQRNDTLPSSAANSRRFEMATGFIWPGGQLPVISIAARAAGIGPRQKPPSPPCTAAFGASPAVPMHYGAI
jgi:hypothetical protein